MIIFNNTSADFVLNTADVRLKIIIILKGLRGLPNCGQTLKVIRLLKRFERFLQEMLFLSKIKISLAYLDQWEIYQFLSGRFVWVTPYFFHPHLQLFFCCHFTALNSADILTQNKPCQALLSLFIM